MNSTPPSRAIVPPDGLRPEVPEPLAGEESTGPGRPARLECVDVLRGLVMIVMALDHTRDYLTNVGFKPTDPEQAGVGLFVTRWITHVCAPVFFLLAGVGAY